MRTMGRVMAFQALWRAVSGQRRPGSPSIPARLRAFPRMVRDTVTGAYPDLETSRLGLMALALVYVVSPIDLVPEAVLALVGVVDDAFVLAWLAGAVLGETEAYLAWDRTRGRDRYRTVPGDVLR